MIKLGSLKSLLSKRRDESENASEALQNAEQSQNIYQALIEERKLRQSLEKELAQKRTDLELAIRDRTKDLEDSNKQLSEQIALRQKISDALVKSQTRLTQAMDAARLGLIDWDLAHGQFYQSDFHDLFGKKELSSDEHIHNLKLLIHPTDYVDVRSAINACLEGEQSDYQLQYRAKSEEGWLWIEESGKVVDRDAKGQALRILGTRRNIQSERARDEQVRLAKSVVDHTSEGVFVLDANGCFLSVNPAYEKMIGLDSEKLVGKSIVELSDTNKRKEVYAQILAEVQTKDFWQGELLEKRYRGDYFPQWTQINAIRDRKGHTQYYAALLSDLSERKAADKKLNYLLNYDDLTKLANRNQFKDQLYRAVLRYKDEGLPFALVTLDIDRFKQFNDSFGHEASDELLREIAKRLSANVQKVDILARVGGNEFACVVTCSPNFDVMKFAERLFKTVTNQNYEIAGQDLALSCSMGVAHVPEHTQDLETLMQYAALAVQKAKFQGGGQIQLFDESLKLFSRERLEMESALRKALQRNELEVHYQPKLDLKSKKINSCEALVRWKHPTKGLISPAEFVNIAEECGLITELGSYVLKAAATQVKTWQDQGFGDISVAVNLSPRQIRDEYLKEVIEGVLSSSGISPACLELELTESVIIEDFSAGLSCLNELKALGLKVSIDDFGTGYSSLSYLKEIPADTLKIDRSFVEGLENSQAQLAIVKAIIVLGHSLNLRIVAEGVENEAQLTILSEHECDFIQGYLVSKPLSASDMETLLKSQ